MRIFIALDIDETIRATIAGFVASVREFAPEARWVRPESFHVTLKFVGEKSPPEVEQIKLSLATIEAGPIKMHFRGYGFFPTQHEPRVFWIGIDGGPTLPALAALVDAKVAAQHIPNEEHTYNPHLTLARREGGSSAPRRLKSDVSNSSFEILQQKLPGMTLPAVTLPDFGTSTAREFFLYQSQPSSNGSIYKKLASFSLRDERLP